jgi:hypothetical protein
MDNGGGGNRKKNAEKAKTLLIKPEIKEAGQ